jgi:hypothetical protein
VFLQKCVADWSPHNILSVFLYIFPLKPNYLIQLFSVLNVFFFFCLQFDTSYMS